LDREKKVVHPRGKICFRRKNELRRPTPGPRDVVDVILLFINF
jgi:hypothetical protein